MSRENGSGPKTVILYARVSTKAQAGEDRYSLRQQIERLREYAAAEGYRVVAEIEDPGYSGAYVERPGLDKVLDLVEAGGVYSVLAQDADRITRDPAHRDYLDDKCEKYGTRLVALDDWGDDTHEGQLLRYTKGWASKGERLKIAERSRRGKLRKAREGKIVAGRVPTFGYDLTPDRDGYVVNEEQMATVREVFRLLGEERLTVYATRASLEARSIPAPGGKLWNKTHIRRIAENDCFKPHTIEDLRALGGISEAVLSKLDAGRSYGVWWFNRNRIKTRQVSEIGPDGKTYRRSSKHAPKPRSEWIGVPVPDAGIPRDLVDAAREAAKGKVVHSSAGRRFWPLASMVFCPECGQRMTCITSRKKTHTNFYYQCRSKWNNAGSRDCTYTRCLRAGELEETVWETIRSVRDDKEELRAMIIKDFERQRRIVRRYEDSVASLYQTITDLKEERHGYLRQNARGVLTDVELDEFLKQADTDIAGVQEALDDHANSELTLERLRQDQAYLLSVTDVEDWEKVYDDAPESQRDLYLRMKLRVDVDESGDPLLTGMFGELSGYTTEQTPW